jgi:hypothetical protein
VFLVTPRLPHLANDSVISLGSSKARKNVVVQPPAVPYFVEPGIAFGTKPVINKGNTVLPYSSRVYSLERVSQLCPTSSDLFVMCVLRYPITVKANVQYGQLIYYC